MSGVQDTGALAMIGACASIGGRRVIEAVDLEVHAGELVGVIGRNGAGKTSLLRAALGLMPLAAGQARLGGRAVATLSDAERAALAGYLPQERKTAWNLPALTVASLGAHSRPPAEARALAARMLARVGLADLGERGVLDMSGGERARVLLARLLATRAPLLVADEPAAGLDPDAQLMVLDILRREAERGAAVLLTLHDLTLAARFCDRLVALDGGRVAAIGSPAEVLTPEGLKAVFGLDGALVVTAHGPVAAVDRSIQ
jgi:iron complex transport system ATP-binding protein